MHALKSLSILVFISPLSMYAMEKIEKIEKEIEGVVGKVVATVGEVEGAVGKVEKAGRHHHFRLHHHTHAGAQDVLKDVKGAASSLSSSHSNNAIALNVIKGAAAVTAGSIVLYSLYKDGINNHNILVEGSKVASGVALVGLGGYELQQAYAQYNNPSALDKIQNFFENLV